MILQTAQLILRPCSPADRADFIALERDPEVMRYLHGGPVDHEAIDPQEVTFLMPRGGEPHVWTARRRSSEAFVGWFSLWPQAPEVAELGYRLRRDAWGQGLASEGAHALAHWGLAEGGYRKVVACTMAVNTASRRVMEKIGMSHVRTEFPDFSVRILGTEQGEVWYELARHA